MRKLICSFIFICSLITFSAATNAVLPLTVAGNDIFSLAPLVEKVSPAVVNISISGSHSEQQVFPDLFNFFSDQEQPPPTQTFVGLGSGVIIDSSKGYIITNFHVIEDADEIKVTLKSGQEFNALLVGQDKQSDIALLQIKTNKLLTQIELANSDNLRVGDLVVAIGNPFGLGQTVTSGIISALGRSGLNLENLENFIQTDAAINSGNSGGALVNLRGELIGINTALIGPSGGNIGIGFAIPSNMINNLVQQLVQFGEIRRGVLGIRGGELTQELTKTFALDSKHGAFIYQVAPDSAAQEAGLLAGDVIISLNGQAISSFSALRAKIGSLSIGRKVQLGIIRDGKVLTVNATLKAAATNKIKLQAQIFHPSLTGATLINQEGKNKNQGVLVSAVEKGSIADNYGLRQGDIIIGINRKRIRNLNELNEFITTAPEILTLNVLRDRRQLFLILN
ncbi:DegQ family serine endoprotease [Psychromonas sp.]|uniref:DegQ family serine endoprotease n=1 Tax=Psychromonas sp. TaxID=1884585 RepID=UPI003564A1A4